MTWPTSDVSTAQMDAGTDTPPRAEFLSWAQKFNQIRAHVTSFMQGLLTSASAADARAALDVPSRSGSNASGTWGIGINAANVVGVMSIGQGGTGASSALDAFNSLKHQASDVFSGTVELATVAETQAGSDNSKATTPLGVYNHTYFSALGWGQSWTDVTGARSPGTTYTNSTGRPIEVKVIYTGGGSYQAGISVNGVLIDFETRGAGLWATVSAIVPHGHTYRVDATGTMSTWSELR